MSTMGALDEIHKLEVEVAVARKALEQIEPVSLSVLEEEVDDYFGFS